MLNQYSRTEFILGEDNVEKLKKARIAVFGIGGVGGNTVEALARCGVGTLDLIDDDKICLTNINRQILATRSTVGKPKVEVARDRIHDIDPRINVNIFQKFWLPSDEEEFDFSVYDYVVDAIDTVTGKIGIILGCQRCNTPVISVMGCGNRIDPTKITVSDLYQTSVDPLARVMRYELKKRGVKKLEVVWSTETPIRPIDTDNSCMHHCICPPGTTRKCTERRDIPGSISFVPPVAGMVVASVIVKDITGFDSSKRTKSYLKQNKDIK